MKIEIHYYINLSADMRNIANASNKKMLLYSNLYNIQKDRKFVNWCALDYLTLHGAQYK